MPQDSNKKDSEMANGFAIQQKSVRQRQSGFVFTLIEKIANVADNRDYLAFASVVFALLGAVLALLLKFLIL